MESIKEKGAFSLFSIPFILILSLTFFLPFERIGSMELSGLTIRISHILLLALGAITISFLFLRKTIQKFNVIYLLLVIYLCIATCSFMFSPNLSRSLVVLSFIIFTSSISFILPCFVQDQRKLQILIKWLLITTILVCLFGIYQFIGDFLNFPNWLTGLRPQYQKEILGFPRIQSTSLEPLYFANFLLIPLSIVFSFLFAKTKQQWLLFLLLTLIGLNIFLTGSRGGYAGLFISSLILLIANWKRIFTFKVVMTILTSACIILISSLLLLNIQSTPISTPITTFTTHITTLFDGAAYVERHQTISSAYDLFLEKPYLGWGIGSFGPIMSPIASIQPESGWAIVNNQVMESLVETGILGTFCLISMFLLLAIQLFFTYKQTKNLYMKHLAIGLFAALFAMGIQYMTFSTLYILHIWFFVGLCVTVIALSKKYA